MVALVGHDPFEEEDNVRYRTAEVTTFPEELPSPLDPRSRRFAFCVAWAVNAGQEACASFVKAGLKSCEIFASETAEVEPFEGFVALTVQLNLSGLGTQPTTEILGEVRKVAEGWLTSIESGWTGAVPLSRSTRQFWREKYGVGLATTWRSAEKTYVWRLQPDGRFVHVDTSEFLEEGSK